MVSPGFDSYLLLGASMATVQISARIDAALVINILQIGHRKDVYR